VRWMTGCLFASVLAWVPAAVCELRGQPHPQVAIGDVRHIKVCYSKNTFCGWPRQCGIANFGNGEIVLLHHHAPSSYKTSQDIGHEAVHARSVVLLQRSLDNGETWGDDNEVVVWRSDATKEERDKLLFHGKPVARLDMSKPGAMFYFHSTAHGGFAEKLFKVFVLRSIDKGLTWDTPIATLALPSWTARGGLKDNHPPVHLGDGSWLVAATVDDEVCIYRSRADGASWEYLARMAPRPATGRYTYAGLILLPDGTVQGYTLHIQQPGSDKAVRGLVNAICMTESRDGGRAWGPLRPIVHPGGDSVWGPTSGAGGGTYFYRSPWPIRLRDGKILVLFAQRQPPYGIGVVVSSDGGKTWSDEFALRKDGVCWDLGYPVATQLDDGRVFTAYYYTSEGSYSDAVRFIAGTFFRVN